MLTSMDDDDDDDEFMECSGTYILRSTTETNAVLQITMHDLRCHDVLFIEHQDDHITRA